jgi:hypothetical protein
LAEENLDWIFVNTIPMLFDKTRIAKQQKIETWLNLYEAVKKLGLEKPGRGDKAYLQYVV